MPKLFEFSQAKVDESLARIRAGVDHGNVNQRPAFDPRERADLVKRTADGRSAEMFSAVMESHGFKFFPAIRVAREALRAGTAPTGFEGEAIPEIEGQWRNKTLRFAYTPSSLLANFLTPEDFDRWIRKEKLKRKLARRMTAKAEVRLALSRL